MSICSKDNQNFLRKGLPHNPSLSIAILLSNTVFVKTLLKLSSSKDKLILFGLVRSSYQESY